MIRSFRNGGVGRDKMLASFVLGLLFQPLVSAATASESLGIHFENGDQDAPLLKLDYATYRATYNETYDVSYHSPNFYKQEADKLADLCFQECEVRSFSSWTIAVGKTSSSIENGCCSGWRGGKIMYTIEFALGFGWIFCESSG